MQLFGSQSGIQEAFGHCCDSWVCGKGIWDSCKNARTSLSITVPSSHIYLNFPLWKQYGKSVSMSVISTLQSAHLIDKLNLQKHCKKQTQFKSLWPCPTQLIQDDWFWPRGSKTGQNIKVKIAPENLSLRNSQWNSGCTHTGTHSPIQGEHWTGSFNS